MSSSVQRFKARVRSVTRATNEFTFSPSEWEAIRDLSDPGFTCRREGHTPALKIETPVTAESIVCACLRCGKTVEFTTPAVKKL